MIREREKRNNVMQQGLTIEALKRENLGVATLATYIKGV